MKDIPAALSKCPGWLRDQVAEHCPRLPLLPEILIMLSLHWLKGCSRMHEKTLTLFILQKVSLYLQSTLGDEEVSDEELLARLLRVLGTNIFYLEN